MNKIQNMMELHRTYWKVIGTLRASAFSAIVIASMAGFFELLTLFVLTPLLGLDFGSRMSGIAKRYFEMFAAGDLLGSPWGQFFLLMLVVTLSIGVRWLAFRHFVDLRFEVAMRLRSGLFERLMTMPWERYHRVAAGSVTNSLGHAVWQIGEGVEQYLLAAANFLIVTVLIGFAFVIAPQLAFIVVAFVAVVALISTVLSLRLKAQTGRSIKAAEQAAIVSHQIFENLKFVRVSGVTEWTRNIFGTSSIMERSGHTKISRTHALHHFGLEFAGMALIGVLILTFRSSETVGFGTFVMFIGLLYRSLPRIQALQSSRFAATARMPWISWWRQAEMAVGLGADRADSPAEWPEEPLSELAFNNVHYKYPSDVAGGERHIIDGLTFRVRTGQLLAIVGSSGAGKSTIVDMLLGLIVPESGKITVNGTDLTRIDLEAWRRSIGYLPQEPLLFAGSVLANVAFADPDPDREKAMNSLKAAQAYEFVSRLPQGIDSEIGERGGRLSGGERQRIALARALYRNPRFLFLDEPTSSLDEENSVRLRQVLGSLKPSVAIVMVTHQASMLDLADEVINLSRPVRQYVLNHPSEDCQVSVEPVSEVRLTRAGKQPELTTGVSV